MFKVMNWKRLRAVLNCCRVSRTCTSNVHLSSCTAGKHLRIKSSHSCARLGLPWLAFTMYFMTGMDRHWKSISFLPIPVRGKGIQRHEEGVRNGRFWLHRYEFYSVPIPQSNRDS